MKTSQILQVHNKIRVQHLYFQQIFVNSAQSCYVNVYKTFLLFSTNLNQLKIHIKFILCHIVTHLKTSKILPVRIAPSSSLQAHPAPKTIQQ